MTSGHERRLAYLHSAKVGAGGLGMCAATTLDDLAHESFRIDAFGPGVAAWPLPTSLPSVTWHTIHAARSAWAGRYTHRRWLHGRHNFLTSAELGGAAADAIAANGADACYAFSAVALETLRWASANRLPSILECATGHIRHFHDVSVREHDRWGRGPHLDHPSVAMVLREEEEYSLAGCVRVSSQWARETFVDRGVKPDRIKVVPQKIDTERFVPPAIARPRAGPLRLCYAGVVSLTKGFPYLLAAMNTLGSAHVTLEIAGSTGSRAARTIFARLARGLTISMQPQDPLPVYQRAELMVFPSLHDGFGFVVAEAMACGLPVIVTRDAGAAEWVEAGCGWSVPSADADALAAALNDAIDRRGELPEMGARARASVLARVARRDNSLPFFDAVSCC
jgi:glycosyltransferase involved in cell wall biosynthesis